MTLIGSFLEEWLLKQKEVNDAKIYDPLFDS